MSIVGTCTCPRGGARLASLASVAAMFCLSMSAFAGTPCGEGAGDCCIEGGNGSPGCDDEFCCDTVCTADPFCCETSWDGICAGAAADMCADLCGGGGGGPENDECDGAIEIFDGSTDFSTIGATDSGPDLPPECDEGFGTALVQDIWYSYTATCSGTLLVSTCDQADYDTRLAAYLDCAGSLVACNDDGLGCGGFTSEMFVEVEAGVKYFIRVGGFGTSGNGTLTLTCEGSGGGPCPGEGDCCEANGSIGCDDLECCETVCESDSFCCDTEWDQLCADAAADLCGELCDGGGGPCPGEGDCCEANGSPGCDDVECCELICDADPFCCDTAWDGICAEAALMDCESCGDDCGEPQCFGDVNGDGIVDGADLGLLCGAWNTDDPCTNLSGDGNVDGNDLGLLLGAWGPCFDTPCGEGAGDCCSDNGTPGCDDVECCEIVCDVDPFCCDTAWDGICADEASEFCEGCSGGGPCPADGDCCVPHENAGCDDATCCESVCAIDPFCCDVSWDELCSGEAEQVCGDLCGGGGGPCGEGAGDCCSDNGTPGCDDVECCDTVCAADSFCCDTSWDGLCADQAADLCGDLCGGGGGGPCGEGAGDCCSSNGSPGCDDVECCELICELDPFCCDTSWDGICADEALDACEGCDGGGGGNPACPGLGSCFEANGTPGCEDEDCCNAVCAQDPFCCDVEWDQLCAGTAGDICPN